MDYQEIKRINKCVFQGEADYPKVVLHDAESWKGVRQSELENGFYEYNDIVIHLSKDASIEEYLHECGHYVHCYMEGYIPDPIMAMLNMDESEEYADRFMRRALAKIRRSQ